MKTWWRRHRPAAPDLFEQEDVDVEVRRVLLPRTRNHIYYSVTATEVVVHTVWGAPQGRGPIL
jgi:hypothetical protein